ncbi:ATP-binding protein [Pseudomonas sp. NFACC37-1]|uniref:ATP-binding protein n=1 Tax=Pseudomonas sp. NFACC37-1 TaxID=1566196 RepID=UPI00147FD0AB|nr:ATP-binding protein [Pseudomonas sp. NFACC37-1]
MPTRIIQLMAHWKSALTTATRPISAVKSINSSTLSGRGKYGKGLFGRKIVADGELWLRPDGQANQVALCLDTDRSLIAGFSGSGKTLIARSLAKQIVAQNLKVLVLLKNRQTTQKVASTRPPVVSVLIPPQAIISSPNHRNFQILKSMSIPINGTLPTIRDRHHERDETKY